MKRFLVLACVLCLLPAGRALAQPTRADYVAQADPICISTAAAEGNAAPGLLRDIRKGRFKAAARKFRRAAVVFSGGVEQLAALERPPADESLLASWIDSLRRQVPIVNRFARALNRRQAKKVNNAAVQLIVAEEKTIALVDTYGFAACNQFGV